jgi:hypothetical protein
MESNKSWLYPLEYILLTFFSQDRARNFISGLSQYACFYANRLQEFALGLPLAWDLHSGYTFNT